MRASPIVNSDETGWRVNGQNSWLWAFVGDKVVRYTISQSRGKGIPKEVLGGNFDGIIVSDFYPAYNQFKHKGKCWVHLLRKSEELLSQNQTRERLRFYSKLQGLYQKILSFRNNLPPLLERGRKAHLIEKELLKISKSKTRDRNLQKLYHLLSKYPSELTLCLKNPKVLPDNNLAERAIRPPVIIRKITGGNRSIEGAYIQEINLSVIETLKREFQNIFPTMKQLVLNYITSNG